MGTHHTLINGTAYAVTGGTDLVNGTKYQIWGGRTLVNGTAYEIGFSDGLTWKINEAPTITNNDKYIYTIDFVSNGERFVKLDLETVMGNRVIAYGREAGDWVRPYVTDSWIDQAYRTVRFDTQPPAKLLAWLQSNAVQL